MHTSDIERIVERLHLAIADYGTRVKQTGDTSITVELDQALHDTHKSLVKHKAQSDIDDLVTALGVTDEWRLKNVKETAMARCNVKKSHITHVEKIIDEAFELLLENTPNDRNITPVATFRGLVDCGEHGAFDLEINKMIPHGALLYTAPIAGVAAGKQQAIDIVEMFANQHPYGRPITPHNTLIDEIKQAIKQSI